MVPAVVASRVRWRRYAGAQKRKEARGTWAVAQHYEAPGRLDQGAVGSCAVPPGQWTTNPGKEGSARARPPTQHATGNDRRDGKEEPRFWFRDSGCLEIAAEGVEIKERIDILSRRILE